MKAPFPLILIVILLSNEVDCCSEDIKVAVDNAFVSCSTRVTCDAECYLGYIFPHGATRERYSCQNGVWTPMLSTCKRNPSVSVTYSANWRFTEVLPSTCKNISSRLDNLKETLEKTLAENCHELNVNATVQFSYSFLSFEVRANFTSAYRNFTSLNGLDLCINYTYLTFSNLGVIKSIFENVTCENLTKSNMISKSLHVGEKHYSCPNDMELHNVTTSEGIKYTQYCDIDTTVIITKMLPETTHIGKSTPESPTLRTEVTFTDIDSNTSQRTTLKNEVSSTDANSIISQGKTLKIEDSSSNESTSLRPEDSSNHQNSNTSQFTTSTEFSIEKDLNIQSIIYIATAAGGLFLFTFIIILIVCLRKRVKEPKNLTDDMKMTRKTNDRIGETSFKRELIENELYKSADDMMDGDRSEDFTKTLSGDFSALPYVKEKTDTTLRQDHGEYSYPSKMAVDNNSRLNIAYDDGDLDVETTDTFRTPNHDSENPCQYAVVNKSRKM